MSDASDLAKRLVNILECRSFSDGTYEGAGDPTSKRTIEARDALLTYIADLEARAAIANGERE